MIMHIRIHEKSQKDNYSFEAEVLTDPNKDFTLQKRVYQQLFSNKLRTALDIGDYWHEENKHYHYISAVYNPQGILKVELGNTMWDTISALFGCNKPSFFLMVRAKGLDKQKENALRKVCSELCNKNNVELEKLLGAS